MTGIIFIDTHSLWSIPSLFLIRINLLSSRICIRKFSRVKLNLNKTIIGEELVKRTTKLHYLVSIKFLDILKYAFYFLLMTTYISMYVT